MLDTALLCMYEYLIFPRSPQWHFIQPARSSFGRTRGQPPTEFLHFISSFETMMKILQGSSVFLLLAATSSEVQGFSSVCPSLTNPRQSVRTAQTTGGNQNLVGFAKTTDNDTTSTSDNKAMAFLRKKGKVGGDNDFTNAIGVDEGTSGKSAGKWGHGKATKKALGAYESCVESGVIDDLTEEFPITCSGTQWAGVTDRVMGGLSSGTLAREEYHGRMANVLRAHVSLENEGGFVQMATDLALNPAVNQIVDASNFDGIEAELYYNGEEETENFNIHLKNSNCLRQFSSYRATFSLPRGEWTKVRIPWLKFGGYGWGAVENHFEPSTLRRLGVVSIGKEVDVTLALSSVGFYKD